MAVTLEGISLVDSPWDLVVATGEIEPTTSITDISTTPAASFEAGMTQFFVVTTYDIYTNLMTDGSADPQFEIIAEYVSTTYTSPISIADYTNWQQIYGEDVAGIASDNGDGTYNCQVTMYRAATFNLNVKINNEDVDSSPFSNHFVVTPADVYAPNCVLGSTPSALVSGTESTY